MVVKSINCTYIYESRTYPFFDSINVNDGESVCLESGLHNTVYSLHSLPENCSVEFYEKSRNNTQLPLVSSASLSDTKMQYFSLHQFSRVRIVSGKNSQMVSFSFVSIKDICAQGIYTTNALEGVISSKTPINGIPAPIKYMQDRCFFIGGVAQKMNISIEIQHDSNDAVFLIRRNLSDESLFAYSSNNLINRNVTLGSHELPAIIRLQASSIRTSRSIEILLSGSGTVPARIASQEFVVRELFDLIAWLEEKWLLIVIPLAIFVIFIVFVLVFICSKIKKSNKVADNTEYSA